MYQETGVLLVYYSGVMCDQSFFTPVNQTTVYNTVKSSRMRTA